MNSSDPLLRLNYAEFLDDTSKILKSNKHNTTVIYSGDITDLQSLAGCSVSFAGLSYTVINKIKRDFDTHFFLKPLFHTFFTFQCKVKESLYLS